MPPAAQPPPGFRSGASAPASSAPRAARACGTRSYRYRLDRDEPSSPGFCDRQGRTLPTWSCPAAPIWSRHRRPEDAAPIAGTAKNIVDDFLFTEILVDAII